MLTDNSPGSIFEPDSRYSGAAAGIKSFIAGLFHLDKSEDVRASAHPPRPPSEAHLSST